MKSVIGVNFNDSKKIYYFLVNDLVVSKGDFVVVLTERGEQFGKVVTDVIEVDESKLNNSLKNVIRVATLDDVSVNDGNISDAKRALVDAKRFVSELNLDM